MSYTLLDHEDLDPRLWDGFLAALPQAHPEQSSAWTVAEHVNGWWARRIAVSLDDRIVAGAQLAFRRVRRLGMIGYIRQGPTLRTTIRT